MPGAQTENICLSQSQMEAIADALGDTNEGLMGSEIQHILATCRIEDSDPGITKRKRLFNAFALDQNKQQHRRNVLEFIRQAMKPERYVQSPGRFEPMRANLNQALAFAGLVVDESGTLKRAERLATLSAARRRAQELRVDLIKRDVHPDVLRFCREELLADNYFHAVLEAVKSVMDKLRERTGLTDDGNALVERALGGDRPMLAINPLQTKSEISEQKGFAYLVRGTVGMFRNPAAHEPRIHWPMTKDDAADLLSLLSLIHRRLDASSMPPRV